MKFSFRWLSDLLDHGLSVEELTEKLTMAGLEVASTAPVAARCSKVVVAEVKSVEPHPDAARLRVCRVYDGKAERQVVCGASNVRAGMYAPFAQVGAVIEPVGDGRDDGRDDGHKKKNLKIGKAKLRGVESHGMLCSAEELGLEDKSDGILELNSTATTGEKADSTTTHEKQDTATIGAKASSVAIGAKAGSASIGERADTANTGAKTSSVVVGTDINQALALDDTTIELDLTPNRGDCLGMIGLAREVGVLSRATPRYPAPPEVKETVTDRFPITISAPAACPRYLGRVIRNVNLKAATPLWLKERLRRSGLRSIDPVVDVTNYILLEYGQPLHAFDLDKLHGGIDVRMAKEGEAITLLDGKELKLRADTLVIADGKQAVAMAGIMGGAHSAVSESTAHIMLECAFFTPLAVAGRARRYGMHTDASHRYERGVDFAIQHQAIAAATALLQEITGGEAGPVEEAVGELPPQTEITLKPGNIERLLGIRLESDEITDVLTRLGFQITAQTDDELKVQVPSFRFDVSIEADLIEELARIHGYNRLPSTRGMLAQRMGAAPETLLPDWRLRRHLAALGYQEIISYSFIDPAWSRLIMGEADPEAVTLENPLSTEMSMMRGSILPGLLQALAYNSNRQQERLRIFEVGMVFRRDDKKAILQQNRIAGLIAGSRHPENWSNSNEPVDFYDIKGDIETLLTSERRGPLAFHSTEAAPFHSGQCAAITVGDTVIGHAGALHPAVQRRIEVPGPVFLFELDLEAVRALRLPAARHLSRQPEVSRDLAVVLDEAVPAADIIREVSAAAGGNLRQVRIFDVYQGEGVAAGEKSVALGLTWQHPSRTLDDQEINALVERCVERLQDKFKASLRS